MSNKKKFHCIFPVGQNVHLIKDVGMIPFMLHKEGYYDSSISFYENESNLPYLLSDVKGLKYKRISKIFKNEDYNIFIFLLCNFWKLDIVMMFHPSFKKLLLANLFHFLSFGALKFYFKLDINESVFDTDFSQNIKNNIKKMLFRRIDLITVETNKINKFLNEKTYIKSKLLPNGFKSEEMKSLPTEKENLFITVGRIGSYSKDTETLLRAIQNLELLDWKFLIIGPIEEDFKTKIDEFFSENPKLTASVFFLGSISDRKKLNEYYKKSKVFVLSSRYESFGLVIVEALSQGNFIVSTDLIPSREIADSAGYGKFYPIEDDVSLRCILQDIIHQKYLLPSPQSIENYANENYNWSVIVTKLYNMLEKNNLS